MKTALAVIAACVVSVSNAAAAPLQSEPVVGPELVRALFEVDPLSPTRARVSAAFEMSDGRPVTILLVWFEGQELSAVSLRDGAETRAVDFDDAPARMRRLRLPEGPAGPRSLYLEYEVAVPSTHVYRYPLAVPVTTAGDAAPTVVVEVVLPAGGDYRGDGFPTLVDEGERGGRRVLRARPMGAPSFVHVVYERRSMLPTPTAVIQALALLVVFAPLVWAAARARRRADDQGAA